MRFTLTLKCPDAGEAAIDQEKESYSDYLHEDGLSEEEIESLIDEREHEMQSHIERWLANGEYLTVMIDTEKNTCEAVPVRGGLADPNRIKLY